MRKKLTKDVYSRITEKIIANLEAGVRPWTKPWNAEHAAGRINKPLRHNGQAYSGINVLMLWSAACDQGFAAPIWMTYRQATAYGGQVRKGENGELVVYTNKLIREEEDPETDEEKKRAISFLKGYTVFNVEQIDGLPENYYELAEPVLDPVARISEAEKFFAATGATINYGGNRAFYAIGPDRIQMPPFECFRDAEGFYSTLCHETVHWTRNSSRLDRSFGRKRWGDEGYAAEELVAELGACFLCADLGIALEPRDDHAAYIENWLKVLKNDNRAIFTAAAHAQRAVEYLHSLQTKQPDIAVAA